MILSIGAECVRQIQQVQRNYQLRNHFGISLTSVTLCSKLLKQSQ